MIIPDDSKAHNLISFVKGKKKIDDPSMKNWNSFRKPEHLNQPTISTRIGDKCLINFPIDHIVET